jgi:DNA-binding PadR family transcriptional regulator
MSDTYEITEKGSAVLQELEKRMAAAKSSTGQNLALLSKQVYNML